MSILRLLATILFLPGTLVLNRMGITIEEDGGIFRSLFNSCFWGAICLTIVLQIYP
ncbi:MAG: hypothetical protein ACR2O0_16325 [Rhizobiaceae bacterium]